MTKVTLRLLFYSLIFSLSLFAGASIVSNMLTTTRGVTYLPLGAARTPMRFGVNANLDQYSDADLARALGMIRDARLSLVRQHFYWKEIEPRQNEYNWDKWDRIVAGAKEYGLGLVAVIETTPVWARDPGEADLDYAPPKNPDDYARFVATIARRYDSIRLIQIWDNPDVHPYWGRRNADPFEYAALLKASAITARAANPNVKVISAGLAPNGELVRERPDYSDVLFLRELYQAGARDYMDIVAAKPYGMWSGPDDRRADKDVYNFSRAVVLRDEMIAHGDAGKPMWAVEFGWNALPDDWSGAPSPWGADREEVQLARLGQAVQRAESEWPWMGTMIVQTFQPSAPSDDPIWGFALVDKNFQPRAVYAQLPNMISAPVAPAAFNFAVFYAALAALAVVAALSAWRGLIAARSIPWQRFWLAIESRFRALPESAQLAVLALAVIAFCVSPNTVLNFVLLALIVILFALRLDLGLSITICTIPFYLFPKNLIGGAQFSIVELLIIACAVAWVVRGTLSLRGVQSATKRSRPHVGTVIASQKSLAMTLAALRFSLPAWRSWLSALRLRPSSLDYAVIFFVLASLLSVKIAANFGVANREFRVIVLEPALLYALVRASHLKIGGLRRLVDALILSALAISLIGLYQFFFTNWVIIGEGVRRILAVYGSPNNLALYLDRVLPIIIALALFDDRPLPLTPRLSLSARGRKIVYALIAIPIALCLYLTYSRAALLVGLPAGLLVVALASGRRARIAIGLLFILGIAAMLPFLQTERAQSLFQQGTGTGFFRVSVWQSAVAMIRDHPVFGVGLDNFLYEYHKYINPDAWREPNLSHPHNLILDFWVRVGIAGVLALVWMLVAFYRVGARTPSTIRGSAGEGVGATPALKPDNASQRDRALAIALMAGMTAAIAHGMIDASYFFVDLAFTWMLMLGVMGKSGNHT